MAGNELVESLKSLSPLGWVILSVWLLYILLLLVFTLRYALKNTETIPEFIPKPEKPKAEPEIQEGAGAFSPAMTRRSFITLLGWAWIAFTAATMGALSTCLRFFFPNVTFEPPLKFKVGFPDQFSIGVDNRFKDEHRVWIVRDDKGFYALSTICTHLGCTPNWLQSEQKFKCPCHGSGYYISGINFEGPAPRPLERFNITLADDGQIQVDEGQKYQYELGQWTLPGAFLDYKA
jgi:cytochrome b6-f complex iron-sulfur subunit